MQVRAKAAEDGESDGTQRPTKHAPPRGGLARLGRDADYTTGDQAAGHPNTPGTLVSASNVTSSRAPAVHARLLRQPPPQEAGNRPAVASGRH